MSGTTDNGWPYVTPDDHPKEFPTHSQALAQQLDAAVLPALGATALRSADDTAPAATEAMIVTTTVAGATGRRVIVTAEIRCQNAATSNLTLQIRNGGISGTSVRGLTLGAQAASSGVDRVYSLSWVGVAASDQFTVTATSSSGTLNVRAGSAVSVAVI